MHKYDGTLRMMLRDNMPLDRDTYPSPQALQFLPENLPGRIRRLAVAASDGHDGITRGNIDDAA